MIPAVSVVIPTYKRKASVLRLLHSLGHQTLPTDQYEVIVVDDGSPDDTATIAEESFPFPFKYVRQRNQGATVARNHGVSQSRGEVLVFIDDDVTVSPKTLETLCDCCHQYPDAIVMGTLIHRNDGANSIYADIQLQTLNHQHEADTFIDFVDCNTELLAVKRTTFFDLGMLQDPTAGQGWPNWDDVDFGYRAHLAGFRLLQAADAVGEHWDYSLGDWQTACKRWQRACKSAVLLFRVHPGLQPHLPMLFDKTPVDLSRDSAGLVVKKRLRQMGSSPAVVRSLEEIVKLLEKAMPSPTLLRPLYRWIAGSYMYRGYQDGLHEFGAASVGGGV